MKLRFVNISNAVQDFIQDTGVSAGTDEAVLYKWAEDAVTMLTFDQQLAHRITILQVEDGTAELPSDFQILTQAAANIFPRTDCDCRKNPNDPCCSREGRAGAGHHRTRIERVSQWTMQSFEDDCEITIDLNCPKCGPGSCSCSDRVIEVDVDRIWELSHPEYYNYHNHFGRAYRVGEGQGMVSYYHPKFEIMKYTHSPYHQVHQILPGCINTYCPGCQSTFTMNNGMIHTDFDRGEVLLSYLGKQLDDNGYVMIPDHPDVHAAISHYLTFKYFLQKFYKGSNEAAARFRIAKQLYQEALFSAISALDVPDFQEFKTWMEDNWFQRLAKSKFDQNNGNTDVYETYKQYIDGSTGQGPRNIPGGWRSIV